jgi:hypothetical protein
MAEVRSWADLFAFGGFMKSVVFLGILFGLFALGCGDDARASADAASGDDAAADASTSTDDAAADDASTEDASEPGDASTDSAVVDRTAALVGVYSTNQPAQTPCLVTLFQQTVVTIEAIDADTFRVTDGTNPFECDITGTDVSCDTASGSTTVQIGPQTYCEWPYTVTAQIVGLASTGFQATVSFSTAQSPTTQSCGAALNVCMGQGTATFSRFVASPQQPTPPAVSAIAKRSGAI